MRPSWMVLSTVTVMATLTMGCAADPQLSPSRGYLASLKTLAPTVPHEPRNVLQDGGRASDYLALGLSFYNDDRRLDAIEAFSRALATGDLNNQGRALAYWHLFLSHREDALGTHGADALDSFVTVARLLVQQSAEATDGEDLLEHVRAFIERFELRDRLLLAEVTLEALWAHRDQHYGRTPDRPVMVGGGARAQRLFLHMYRPCVDEEASQAAKVSISRAAFLVHDTAIDEAAIECPGESEPISFFFATAP